MLQSKIVRGGENPSTKAQDLSASRRGRAVEIPAQRSQVRAGDASAQKVQGRTRDSRSPLKIMREKIRSLSNRTPRTSHTSERGMRTPRDTTDVTEGHPTGLEIIFPWRREGNWTPRSSMSYNTTPRRTSELAGSVSTRGSRRVLVPGSTPRGSNAAAADISYSNKSPSSSMYRNGINRGMEEPLVQPQRVESPAPITPSRGASITLQPESSPRRHSVYVDKLPLEELTEENSHWRIFHSTVLTPRSPARVSEAVTPRSARRKSPIRPREYEGPAPPDEVTFKLNDADIQEIIDPITLDTVSLSVVTPRRSGDAAGETTIQTEDYSHNSRHLSEPRSRVLFIHSEEWKYDVQGGKEDEEDEDEDEEKEKEEREKEENEKEIIKKEIVFEDDLGPLPGYKHVSISVTEAKKNQESGNATPHSGINGSRPRSESTATSTPRSDVAPSYLPLSTEDGAAKSGVRSLHGSSFTPRGTPEKTFDVPPSNTISSEKSTNDGKWKEPIIPYRTTPELTPPSSVGLNGEETSVHYNSTSKGSGFRLVSSIEKKDASMASKLSSNDSMPRKVTFRDQENSFSVTHSEGRGENEVVVTENKTPPVKDIKTTSHGKRSPVQLNGTKLELTPPSSVEHNYEETSDDHNSATRGSEFLLGGGGDRTNKTSITSKRQTNGKMPKGVMHQDEKDLPIISGSHEGATLNSNDPPIQNNVGHYKESTANEGTVEAQKAGILSGWSHSSVPGDSKSIPIILPSPDSIVRTLIGQ
ncbi:uncharacterized protein TM35_000023660 [Trypanosoma theileri]|uniref:Uncharacterized protein n=1 Tax=Trypanosoma theileri TaxID=67003 RepID=A0A1X0P9B1_9TRYP|nr:uncharacterized protein TM35_000023660 [Trypanosoma theileri]ORC93040.1 hypothetical protein TM35_000023660 [Trypanosoma theileri]